MGTGFVYHVSAASDNKMPCPCDECKGEIKIHWKIYVRTARHVVFNSEEAEKTKIDFFYDDTDSLIHGMVKSVWGIKLEVEEPDPKFDESVILCITHDENLVRRIKSDKSHWKPFINYSPIFYPNNRGLIDSLPTAEACRKYAHAVIFSHPHYMPKMVSVGKWNTSQNHSIDISNNGIKFQYQTPTCSGCSGAPVILIHPYQDLFNPNFFPWSGPVHSGTKTLKKVKYQDNYSKSLEHTYPVL
ncbi:hypothetical protein ElyMa_000308300 [Elysia marginata]|uniref:Uncharacterized protein n=1 Tax=Elysia marginata TaxID=1093978 RepID=A0AAV4F8K8_9GAST|nr:hypothetical protein ElyMa_000308300 [Elysia marginata]